MVSLRYDRARFLQLWNIEMARSDVVMTHERLREVEGLAHTMLWYSVSISPYHLANRAKINWFAARDILRGLARKGHATVLRNGRFGRSAVSPNPAGGNSK
jgi:ribosomal protein S25